MKLILLLTLALCAGTLQATPIESDDAAEFGVITDIVDEAVAYAHDIIGKVKADENGLLNSLEVSSDSKVQGSLRKILDAIKQISNIAKTSIVAKVCVQQHADQMTEVENKFNANVEHCKEEAKTDAIEVEREIWQTYMLLYKHVREMYDVIDECFQAESSSIKQKMCVVKKITFLKSQVKSAYELVKGSFARLGEMIPRILSDFGKCLLNSEQNGIAELQAIMQSVKTCIDKN